MMYSFLCPTRIQLLPVRETLLLWLLWAVTIQRPAVSGLHPAEAIHCLVWSSLISLPPLWMSMDHLLPAWSLPGSHLWPLLHVKQGLPQLLLWQQGHLPFWSTGVWNMTVTIFHFWPTVPRKIIWYAVHAGETYILILIGNGVMGNWICTEYLNRSCNKNVSPAYCELYRKTWRISHEWFNSNKLRMWQWM